MDDACKSSLRRISEPSELLAQFLPALPQHEEKEEEEEEEIFPDAFLFFFASRFCLPQPGGKQHKHVQGKSSQECHAHAFALLLLLLTLLLAQPACPLLSPPSPVLVVAGRQCSVRM